MSLLYALGNGDPFRSNKSKQKLKSDKDEQLVSTIYILSKTVITRNQLLLVEQLVILSWFIQILLNYAGH